MASTSALKRTGFAGSSSASCLKSPRLHTGPRSLMSMLGPQSSNINRLTSAAHQGSGDFSIMEQTIPVTVAAKYMEVCMKTAMQLVEQSSGKPDTERMLHLLQAMEPLLQGAATKGDTVTLQQALATVVADMADIKARVADMQVTAAFGEETMRCMEVNRVGADAAITSIDLRAVMRDLATVKSELSEVKALLTDVLQSSSSSKGSGSTMAAHTSQLSVAVAAKKVDHKVEDNKKEGHSSRAGAEPGSKVDDATFFSMHFYTARDYPKINRPAATRGTHVFWKEPPVYTTDAAGNSTVTVSAVDKHALMSALRKNKSWPRKEAVVVLSNPRGSVSWWDVFKICEAGACEARKNKPCLEVQARLTAAQQVKLKWKLAQAQASWPGKVKFTAL